MALIVNVQQGQEDFLIKLLKNLAFVQSVERITDDNNTEDADWWHELTEEQQKQITASVEAIKNGSAKTVSSKHVRDRVKQFLEQKKGQK